MSQDKSALLGKVSKRPRTGGFRPDKEILSQPLDEGVIRSFCQDCGQYLEITDEGAIELAKHLKVNPDISWQGHYFTLSACWGCTNVFDPISIDLIP